MFRRSLRVVAWLGRGRKNLPPWWKVRPSQFDRFMPAWRKSIEENASRGAVLSAAAADLPRVTACGKFVRAEVAELADAHGSGPCARKGVGVRVPSSAPRVLEPWVPGRVHQRHAGRRLGLAQKCVFGVRSTITAAPRPFCFSELRTVLPILFERPSSGVRTTYNHKIRRCRSAWTISSRPLAPACRGTNSMCGPWSAEPRSIGREALGWRCAAQPRTGLQSSPS